MLDIFTVSFFGHKDFSFHNKYEEFFSRSIKELISSHEYVEFLVGKNGEFDQFVTSALRNIKKDYSYSNFSIILVLPYETADFRNNMTYYENYYDQIEICSSSSMVHFKGAIQARNREMINRSELIISYVDKNSGGAYQSVKYALSQNKHVINLTEFDS